MNAEGTSTLRRSRISRNVVRPLAVLCLSLSLPSSPAQEREATPAVVNPALRSPIRQTLSLDGKWDFATDPAGVGDQQKWFALETALPSKISLQVPGCWEAQGVGGVGDSKTVYPEKYPPRSLIGSYHGAGWYRKELVLPKDWANKQIWLKIGGVNAQGWFWVNGTYVGHNQCYCGTYKYNITDLVKPGEKIVVAAKVRNDVASCRGLASNWYERFGGLYRSVELDATPALLIDDAYVAGEFDQQSCVVHVKLRSTDPTSSPSRQVEVGVSLATLDGTPAGSAQVITNFGGDSTLDVTLPASLHPFRAWSPEEPNLYRADIVFKVDGQPIDGWVERFGARKWEVRGGNFYFNNRKHFIRGYGDDSIYPLTIASPASRQAHKQHLQLARSYGFNYVRHHTHCELPEFYEAADEAGIMIQPELPYYGAASCDPAPGCFDLKRDLAELITQYRRYVSLSTYCMGNEGQLKPPLDRELYQLAKELDPTRLAIHQDGGLNRKDNADFHQGPIAPWAPGTQDASWPYDAHEYLNLATDEDPRLAGKYVGGLLPLVKPEEFRAELAKAGLSWEWGIATLDAGKQLQSIYQKRGLEQARLDPACGGYIYWTIVDVGAASAQGLLNQFWEPKASTAEYFRQFNSPTAVLATFSPPERILEAGEDLSVQWWISPFDSKPLHGQPLGWRLEVDGKALASGELPPMDVETGEVKSIGATRIKAPDVTKPAKLRLVAELPGTGVGNSWDIWVFPHRVAQKDAGESIGALPQVCRFLKQRYPALQEVDSPLTKMPALLLADRFNLTVVHALEQGRNILLLQLPGGAPGVELGWWGRGEQAGTAIARHPAFGDFPHDGYLNELLFRELGSTISPADEAVHQVEPLIITRGSSGYLLYGFQAKAGPGKLLASGLKLLSEYPEAAYLLDQFIDYARSAEFQPQGIIDPNNPGKQLEALLALGERLNGWDTTIQTSERHEYNSFLGQYPMCVARQTDGASQVVWKTRPAPKDLNPANPHTFAWVAGLGWASEPSGKFTLFLDGRPLLDLDVTLSSTTWQSTDGRVTLKYIVNSSDGQDSSGIMELKVPASLLKPGEPVELRMLGSAKGSNRWFGLYEAA